MAKLTFDYFEVMEVWESINAIGGEDIATGRRGKYMRIDATSGKAVYGNGTTSGEVGVLRGLAMNNQKHLGDAVTLLRYGLVDIGNELDSLDYGASVYVDDDDGALGSAGADSTTTSVAGKVYPVTLADGTILKKLLVDLR
jgi:hypothetical protein